MNQDRNQIAVLIPAHNEALSIGATFKSILPQLNPQDRVVVVADNCTDETAAIAEFIKDSCSQIDVTILERQDSRRGKGYALDYGLRFLESDPPSAVVLIDADCIVHPETIQRLARQALNFNRPIQATYFQELPSNPTPQDAISALAILVKNVVRLQGLENLSQPCLLYGTGMAFPWSVISTVSLATSNIVEDMQLAIDLAIAGYPPLYCPEAKVTGILPQERQAVKTQRTRWEHGHLQTLITQVPRLLKAAIKQKRFDLVVLGLDLAVPPLSLLVMVWIVAMAMALLLSIVAGVWVPTLVLALAGLLIFVSIALSWIQLGREIIPASVLWTIPLYILAKIPLYIAFLIKPQTQWIKTKRDKLAHIKF